MAKERPPLPSRDRILAFIQDSEKPVGRREIARAFNIKGPDRAWLRRELKKLKEDGLIGGDRRRASKPGHLPPVAVIEVSHIDNDGELMCIPAQPNKGAKPPNIFLNSTHTRETAPGIGDRLLARLKRAGDGTYEARLIKLLEKAPTEMIGLFRVLESGGILQPIDRRSRNDFTIAKKHCGTAEDGNYVVAQSLSGQGHNAKVIEILGARDDPKIISLLVMRAKGVPMEFDPESVALANSKEVPPLGKRTDFRDKPLVTIDGPDARDFDDAVWAEPDKDPGNEGGWHLLVAIADVAYYIHEGDILDRTARLRGNSVYCPDRVVPMLPEALSNGVCSLNPHEPRACLIAEMWISNQGTLRRSEFKRGLMRSAARLTYEQVQQAHDGSPDKTTEHLMDTVIRPLYGAFHALDTARQKRGTLDLDIPERQIHFNNDGRISAITLRERLDSHRLIEEFMITANVAAAKTLEDKRLPVMYRVHEPPALEKMEALSQALHGLGIKLAKNAKISPKVFASALRQAEGEDKGTLVSEIILRSQSQAVYAPAKLGHFGLALSSYCHFTSPIRRYADLLVHRALITAVGLGTGGLGRDLGSTFEEIGEEISAAERRAMTVEREVRDRLVVTYVADRVGATFDGQITGVTRYGLFIRLNETGAEGLLPIRMLPDDWYNIDDAGFSMIGERAGLRFRLGEIITIELAEAEPITGSLSFRFVKGGTKMPKQSYQRKGRPGKRRGRPSHHR
ncbi:ribonuclease R [Alphaproteobacteria bacterium]|nr:ribonuclease R [Alphaproteobacteria bacterium]